MAQQRLNFGTAAANDGEFLPTAFLKIDQNFSDLYGFFGNPVAALPSALAGALFQTTTPGGVPAWTQTPTLGVAGSVLGTLALAGNTSGTTVLQPAAAASGALTLPAATDTLVGRSTTDTLSNKTLVAPVIGAATGTSLSVTAALTAFSGTAIPAGGTAGSGFLFSSTSNFGIFFGSGAPTLSAAQGSLYLRSDGTQNNRLYINTNGSTTWTAFNTTS